jgi:hypothetical protein
MSVILATWEAKIKRITAQGQPGQIVYKNSISKVTRAKWTGSVAQAVGVPVFEARSPEFKP